MADEQEDLKEGQPETEEQKKDKISKKHAEAMKFVTALVGGEANLRPRKTLRGNTTAKVVALLFKKEQEEQEAKAMEDIKGLLKKYVEFQGEVNKKKKELEQLELQKKKEFTEAVNNLKKTIDQQEVMNESYTSALTTATEELAKKKEQ